MMAIYPFVIEISSPGPEVILEALEHEGVLFLDSSAHNIALGRYSFIGFSPFQILNCREGRVFINDEPIGEAPFDILASELKQYRLSTHDNLPPFQGGAAGMFGYELGSYLEKLPTLKQNDLQFPECIIGFYDLVIAWDHVLKKAWVFSSGFPYLEESARKKHAQRRLEWAMACIEQAKEQCVRMPSWHLSPDEIISTFTPQTYENAVLKVIDYIRAGDIFEANISQRFSVTFEHDTEGLALYQKLRRVNPAPFSAYMQFKHYTIASASPERFLQLRGTTVQTRPIKGTRRRHQDPVLDTLSAQALEKSEKDRAENIMIVDLMRNDLSRVCLPHSVKVPQLCKLESFATVHHLVSVVEGELMPDKTAIDLIRATFPGGSITGAPKIRAMEIIAEIEPTVRGPYCGSIGYIGFNGEMDLSITIRTFVLSGRQLTFQVGGAITVDSNPQEEYEETLVKASALQRTLTQRD